MGEPAETIFDKILSGELPSHRVYEDEHVYSFLDIYPLSPGHTLVIPRKRVAYLHQLDDECAAALGRALPRIARAVMKVTGATEYNVLQNNGRGAHQAVFHVHFHVIPKMGERGLGIGWIPSRLDSAEGEKRAAAMREALAQES